MLSVVVGGMVTWKVTARRWPTAPGTRPHGGTVGHLLMQALPLREALGTLAGLVQCSLTAQPVTRSSRTSR